MITKPVLQKLYLKQKKSANQIATELDCSATQVNYWLGKHDIKKRSISEAVYIQSNPNGDPFVVNKPTSNQDWFLYGLGLGLFWGEGNKANETSVRLGNTDPALIKLFLEFLQSMYSIDVQKLRFGLQIFSDVDPGVAQDYWVEYLQVSPSQFQKVVVTRARAAGTYRKKNQYGVLTIYFSNKKLRDIIVGAVNKLQRGIMPT